MITNPFTLICLLTAMAGPPGFYYENSAYLTLYPIDRSLCPNINQYLDITFELYTNKNPTKPKYLFLNKNETIETSGINFSQKIVFYFHGFMENGLFGSAKTVRDAYMQRDDYNVIVVNAERLLAGPWYFTAARNIKTVGMYTATFIDYLITQGLELRNVHLIGHSLGGQTAGIVGYNVKSGKIPRITGLDPAKPLFESAPLEVRLDPSDAEFVDIIHTAAGTFGLEAPLGHVDFYPNGGSATQPGCLPLDIYKRNPNSLLEQIFCSHWRSYLFYAESVLKPESFPSTMCDSWDDYNSGICTDNCNCIFMGFGADKNIRGKFYLRTNNNPPYSKI